MTVQPGRSFCRAVVAMLVFVLAPIQTYATEHTNIVIIYADDLGNGDLGCYGHPTFKTPRLDKLAEQGARLTQFYSSCPYCGPARGSLLTGRYPMRHGLVWNPAPDGPDKKRDEYGMDPSEITLAEVLKEKGYATACIGKWHLGHKMQYRPLRQGFDEYVGILYSNDMRPVEVIEGDNVAEYPVYQATLTQRYTDRAIEFVTRNKENPFFLYLPHAMPHKPLAASEDFYKKTGTDLYGDVITELDHHIGRLIDALHELELAERTLVFFTSDNGPWYGGSTGGLRGMKGRTWEGGIRVPLIVYQPGTIPAGVVSHEPAIIMDLFTTSIAATEAALPQDRIIDGKNILPLLTEKAKSPHEVLFSNSADKVRSVRVGDWKLFVNSPGHYKEKHWKPDEEWIDPRAPDGVTIIAPYEQTHPSQYPGLLTGDDIETMGLFNLAEDPGEQKNVFDEHPDVVKRLQKHADEFLASLKQ